MTERGAMPTAAAFRFSTCLTFALSCAAVGYAEAQLLPEVAVFAVLSIVMLGVLYYLEGRYALLSIPAANRLGLTIALGYALWVGYRVHRAPDAGELIVPMCGPLVILLLLAKSARRDKHTGDYWVLHGIALAGIGLAGAFAEEPISFALVGLYAIAAVWSLLLFHLGRASGTIPPIPGGATAGPPTTATGADRGGHRAELWPAVVWAAVALALAGPLYLLTPRSTAPKAEFGKSRVEIGFAADQMLDLNRTGALRVNPEIAFEVTARKPDGSPKTNLNPDQRWSGRVLGSYGGGEWKPSGDALPLIEPLASHPNVWYPPALGSGQYALEFDVPARLGATFLAEPVLWAAHQPSPLAAIRDGAVRGWLPVADGSFFWEPDPHLPESAPRQYVQLYRTERDPDIGPPFRFKERKFQQQLEGLRENPVPRVKEYADALRRELVRAGELPEECRDPISLAVLPEYQDKVARRFAHHLATTPTLGYTTNLKRTDTRVDPVEDFLFYTKAGHCERFATALVLMLRSQGIPAVLVLGFKGWESDGDGQYTVRQEHAHAWVAALVAKPGVPADPRDPLSRWYQWRSLDPTGSTPVAETDPTSPWVQQANDWLAGRFQEYLTNYTPDQRQKSVAGFAAGLASPEALLGAALVGVVLGARVVRRRIAARRGVRAPAGSAAGQWFAQLVALLSAHGSVPAPGETQREFAGRATAALRERPGCSSEAEVPLAWAEAYYQYRYGDAPPSDARLAELESGLGALRRALGQRT